jgi:WD40 repeat protein
MPQLASPPPTAKSSSGDDVLAFQRERFPPAAVASTTRGSPAASTGSKKSDASNSSGGGFFNKLLKKRSSKKNSKSKNSLTSSLLSGNTLERKLSHHDSRRLHEAHAAVAHPEHRLQSVSRAKLALLAKFKSNSSHRLHGDVFDKDDTSMYDDDDDDEADRITNSGASSLSSMGQSPSSSRTDVNFIEDHIYQTGKANIGAKVQDGVTLFPALDLGLTQYNEGPWQGLNLEALYAPKYLRVSKRKKEAPKVLNNLFLAQEIDTNDDVVDPHANETDSASSDENNDSNFVFHNEDADIVHPDDYLRNEANTAALQARGRVNGNTLLEQSEGRHGTAGGRVSFQPSANISPSPNRSPEPVLNPSQLGFNTQSQRESPPVSRSTKKEIFVMEFSADGKYLAAAGKDATIRIWKVISSPLARLAYKSQEGQTKKTPEKRGRRSKGRVYPYAPVFHPNPIRIFKGHSHNIISLDWSKNDFLISGSMDRTVRLWHVDRSECLQTFPHEDFVTGVKFHPTDDRFFLSGSLDNKLRLWSILEQNVAYMEDLGDDVLITAVAFTPDGLVSLAGGFNGSFFSLQTKGLHLLHRYEVKDKHSVNPFHNKHGNKITGIKVFESPEMFRTDSDDENYTDENSIQKSVTRSVSNPNHHDASEGHVNVAPDVMKKWSILVTTNDSKVRLVNSHHKKLVTRFKGHTNNSSFIVASVSDDHKYIISGSEDHWCYVWENNNSIINNRLRTSLKEFFVEGKHQLSDLHSKHKRYVERKKAHSQHLDDDSWKYEIVSNENSSYASFHAHHSKVNVALFAPAETTRLLELSDDTIYDLVKRYKADNKNLSPTPLVPGYIIVTTDQQGLIRVFRQDSAANIRKRINLTRKKCVNKKSHPQSYGDNLDVCDSTRGFDATTGKNIPISALLGGQASGLSHLNSMRERDSRLGLRRNLLIHGRSLSPVPANIRNKISSKMKRKSSVGPSTGNAMRKSYSEQPASTSVKPQEGRMVHSESVYSKNGFTPKPPANGMFDTHAVPIDFKAATHDSDINSFIVSRRPSAVASMGNGALIKPVSPDIQSDSMARMGDIVVPRTNHSQAKIPLLVNTMDTDNKDESPEIIDFKTPNTHHPNENSLDKRIGEISFKGQKERVRKWEIE